MKRTTVGELCERYIDHLEASEPARLGPVRANLHRLLKHTDPTEPLESFVTSLGERVASLRTAEPPVPASSARAIKSHAVGALKWGCDEGFLPVSENLAASVGLVATDQFAHWREDPRALTVYKLLVAEMAISGTSVDWIDDEFLAHFLDRLPDRISSWRACWSAFVKRWISLTRDGVLPEMELPLPSSARPSRYAVHVEDLPSALQAELMQVSLNLEGASLAERLGSQPLDGSTVVLVLGTIRRLLGFLIKELGVDPCTLTLSGALSLENARALVQFTNERSIAKLEAPDATKRNGRTAIGEYQLGVLRQLAAAARLGLRDTELHAQYSEEVRFAAKDARVRRECRKEPGHVDDYYRVAVALTERALANLNRNAMTVTQATLLRDGLIFALLAAHGYRRTVMAGIHLTENVRVSADGSVTICVPLEDTKPALRDMQLELPQELRGLWRLYVERARPALLCGNRTQSLLVAQGGGALSDSAIYAIVVARSEEVLGARHNPHQARKGLATDHGLWSNGDYLSVSAVLDSSPLTLQKHYADLQGEKRIARFDEATSSDWQRAKGGTKP